MRFFSVILKRICDFIFALFLLLLASPVLLFIYLLLHLAGLKPLFRQKRLGLNGVEFEIFKFRTMNELKNSNGDLLPDEFRLTKFGNLLRKTSLDELPQLFNILIGDMSFVGPRPLLSIYKNRYSSFQYRRHLVKPGVTGWAQVNGRNSLSWVDKFKLDVWYVENWNLFLDFRTLYYTVIVIFNKTGVNTTDNKTMPEFLGNLNNEER